MAFGCGLGFVLVAACMFCLTWVGWLFVSWVTVFVVCLISSLALDLFREGGLVAVISVGFNSVVCSSLFLLLFYCCLSVLAIVSGACWYMV